MSSNNSSQSNSSSPPCRYPDGSEYGEEVLIVFMVLFLLCGLLALLTNGTVLFVGLKSRRKIFGLPVISLAIVDLLTGLVSAPQMATVYYYSKTIS